MRHKDWLNFDKALFGHIAFTIGHAFGALFKGLTGSHFVAVPDNVAPETRRYYQQLTRFRRPLLPPTSRCSFLVAS